MLALSERFADDNPVIVAPVTLSVLDTVKAPIVEVLEIIPPQPWIKPVARTVARLVLPETLSVEPKLVAPATWKVPDAFNAPATCRPAATELEALEINPPGKFSNPITDKVFRVVAPDTVSPPMFALPMLAWPIVELAAVDVAKVVVAEKVLEPEKI